MTRQPAIIKEKLAAVAAQRQKALSLPAKEAMDLILGSPDAPAIVHSMADQDFYFLVNDIGPEDALELLALGSGSQWEHITDIECWHKDRISGPEMLRWFDLLMRADKNRFVQWMAADKHELLELLLYYTTQASAREHDQEPSEFDESFFTFDDVFYVRFTKRWPQDPDLPETLEADHEKMLYAFLKHLAEIDFIAYRDLLFYTANVLPTEAEEEVFRQRSIRLAEKGLLPFDEAVGIYQPLPQGRKPVKKPARRPAKRSRLPVPVVHHRLLKKTTLFAQALERVDSPAALEELSTEFAALCNSIVVADGARLSAKKELAHVVNKACGYIAIGLFRLAESKETLNPSKAAALMTTHALGDIFRSGYGAAMEIKRTADRWHSTSWCSAKQLPVSFWGEERAGILAGLLIKRPLFFDAQTGLPREFESMEDIDRTRAVLDEIMTIDGLLKKADVDPAPVSGTVLTATNLVLTLWARSVLDLPETVEFIPVNQFGPFLSGLFKKAEGKEDGRIQDDKKESFLQWLSGRTGVEPHDISAQAGHVLERMFAEAEAELGAVAPKDLDPKFVQVFLVS
ncbi:DUF6178 family protein [Desulfosudis oleivorans]|uniref:Conserved hypothetical cytosolic protein n=1 Tax=Desulfosudis oleivorans (strain DSM 6200 / JCM 39069 / Hxd3) TaxID=96561 RepID=A8ZT24_DESOH|nr:DUF6178 family protein [Desulfosudis oleivorans]ABW66188.1 conserved hypothetical cytosolic protein [Desulfosudis oleivorans Hxd3]